MSLCSHSPKTGTQRTTRENSKNSKNIHLPDPNKNFLYLNAETSACQLQTLPPT